MAVDDLLTIDHADDATGQIVLAFAIHLWHLRSFTADQCAASCSTRARESSDELIENACLKFFAADVIEKEKRPAAEYGDVVHAVIHQIGADGVVPVRRESDFHFRADAIDAGDQHR